MFLAFVAMTSSREVVPAETIGRNVDAVHPLFLFWVFLVFWQINGIILSINGINRIIDSINQLLIAFSSNNGINFLLSDFSVN